MTDTYILFLLHRLPQRTEIVPGWPNAESSPHYGMDNSLDADVETG